MKLTKKGGGIAVAVVLAGGLAAAGTTTAFAAPAGSAHSAAAKSAEKKDAGKKAAGRAARFLHGQHGEKTVTGKDGKTVTHEWQVGKVTAVGTGSLTVQSGDGVSWTWTTSADTKVRAPQHAAAQVGDEVLVTGVKAGTGNEARVVVDPGQDKIQKWEQKHQQAPQGKHRKAPGGNADKTDKAGNNQAPATSGDKA